MTVRVHTTRSTRVSIVGIDDATPDVGGFDLTIENLRRNEGLHTQFSVKRSIYTGADQGTVTVYNLGPEQLGALESIRGQPGDLLDLETYGGIPEYGQIQPPGDQGAVDSGLVVVTLEAGYEGAVSEIFSAVSASVRSDKPDGKTTVTTIEGVDSFNGILYGVGAQYFGSGTPLFVVAEQLRQLMGLGPGNFNEATFTLLAGQAVLPEGYSINANAYEHLKALLGFVATTDGSSLTWFIDGGELWIMSRKGFIADAPPTVLGRAKRRPTRLQSGLIEYPTFLTPGVRPGRLVVLTADGLGIEGAGTIADVARSDIPPGTYRADEVEHVGGTAANDEFTTIVRCWPTPIEGVGA